MALGFTSHYTKSEQPFGSLILGNTETETSGSVASNDNNSFGICSLHSGECYDYCDFSVSVNIDYSQYANFVAYSSGSTETAGSVAFSGGDCGGSVSSVSSFSGGGGSCSCSTSFTC